VVSSLVIEHFGFQNDHIAEYICYNAYIAFQSTEWCGTEGEQCWRHIVCTHERCFRGRGRRATGLGLVEVVEGACGTI